MYTLLLDYLEEESLRKLLTEWIQNKDKNIQALKKKYEYSKEYFKTEDIYEKFIFAEYGQILLSLKRRLEDIEEKNLKKEKNVHE